APVRIERRRAAGGDFPLVLAAWMPNLQRKRSIRPPAAIPEKLPCAPRAVPERERKHHDSQDRLLH
ncbi:MAG: hypothetical protein VX183_09205, partial [Pseudomonadota bacterium]|nr:hypothetical protein [Pseudomonadota bacterium]MEC8282739.1 hypothetical protein [Pseudomonadota bacterium]